MSHIASAVVATPSGSGAPRVTPERLDVYRVAAEFQRLASDFARRSPHPFRDQLERASLSVVLNIAEGYGRSSPRTRRACTSSPAAARANAKPSWRS